MFGRRLSGRIQTVQRTEEMVLTRLLQGGPEREL